MDYVYFLFDIDGTLVRSEGVGWRSIRESCRDVLGNQALPLIELGGQTDRGIFMEILEHFQLPANPWLDRLVAAYHRRLAANWDPTAFVVLPGVRELVAQIAGTEWAIPGLLTGNSPIGAETKLSRAHLWDFFRIGFYGDQDRCRNELARRVPSTLREANAGCEKLNIVIIGDTLADIACARAIDSRVIAVSTGFATWESLQSAQPDYLVRDLRQISLEEFREQTA